MQILANALPGFRDLRAPLIAGYMWLLFAWLLAEPHLDRYSTGLGGAIYDLSQRVGPIWVALAVGVAAYLVGAVSQALSSVLREAVLVIPGLYPQFEGQLIRQLESERQRGLEMIEAAFNTRRITSGARRNMDRQVQSRFTEAMREAMRELDLPATLLVGDQSELFAEVDRLRAEGELRMGVVPPLLALAVLFGINASPWWVTSVPAICVLFLQGVRRDFDSKKIIADATRIGRVQSSSHGRFAQWIDEVVPAEIEKRNGSDAEGAVPQYKIPAG